MQFSSIWLIDRTLSDATTPQSSSITGTTPSDCLVSYPGHSWEGSCPSAEKQLTYSTAPADWAIEKQMIISCASWWLCAMKAVSWANMSSRTRIFLIFLADLNLLVLNRYPFFLGRLSEEIRQDYGKKNWGKCRGKYTAVSPCYQPHMVRRILLLS